LIQIRPFAAALDRFRAAVIVATALLLLASAVLLMVPATAAAKGGDSPGEQAQAAAGSLIAPQGRCAGEQIASTAFRDRATRAVVCLVNYARRQIGRPGYDIDRGLNRSASLKAGDILRCDAFSHSACGRPFTWWIDRRYVEDARCWRAAENIAWATYDLGSARMVFKAWMRSPGHRSAILSRQYEEIGIGFRIGELRGRDAVRVWVQHFGEIC
jgi:uncharacterized protein YkwD